MQREVKIHRDIRFLFFLLKLCRILLKALSSTSIAVYVPKQLLLLLAAYYTAGPVLNALDKDPMRFILVSPFFLFNRLDMAD